MNAAEATEEIVAIQETNTTNEKDLDTLLPSDERLSTREANLAAFIEMFEVDGLEIKDEYAQVVEDAPKDVAKILSRPFAEAKNFLDQVEGRESLKASAEAAQKQYDKGIEGIKIFSTLCEDLGHHKCNFGIAEDKYGGLRINVTPRTREGFGNIGDDKVSRIEIVIRDGTNIPEGEEVKTPQQLNFRFLRRDANETPQGKKVQWNEVTSWRLDMHPAEGIKQREEHPGIELDAVAGGKYMDIHHEPIESLQGEDYAEQFRALEAAFLLQFSNKFMLRKNENGQYDVDPEIMHLHKKSAQELQLLAKHLQKAEKLIGREDTSSA